MMFDALPPPTAIVQVTPECVVAASNTYKVPPRVILSVLQVEKIQVGAVAPTNSNQTVDMGPMGINTIHLKTLKPFGIDAARLKNDGCLNVHIGAYLLKTAEVQHMKREGLPKTDSDYWRMMANYHSATPVYNKQYAEKLKKADASLPSLWKDFRCESYNACNLVWQSKAPSRTTQQAKVWMNADDNEGQTPQMGLTEQPSVQRLPAYTKKR